MKTMKTMIRQTKMKRLWLVVLLPVSFAILLVARLNPQATEQIYSMGFYPVWASGFALLTGWLPFSLAEWLLVGFVLWALGYTIHTVAVVVRRKERRGAALREWAATAVACLSVGVFIFALNCGPNYHRYTFTRYSGLEVRDSSREELAALCAQLTARANELAGQVQRDASGEMMLSKNVYETAKDARAAYAELARVYPVLAVGAKTTPKPVTLSLLLSYARITGIFSAYTYEANVNVHTNDYTIPATMCHELTHVAGFMREDEANFIAYLASRGSQNPDFAYSGTLHAFTYVSNALYSEDRDLWKSVVEQLDQRVWLDLRSSGKYWRRFETKFGDFSEKVNDTYLKVNSQQDGIKSYGRMIDLLLAEYRQHSGQK